MPVNLTEQLKVFNADTTVHAIIGRRRQHRDAFLASCGS
jgi:hypothetical protein